MSITAASIHTVFTERYQTTPVIVRSPGRINLIGEHTDYNNGFVLPAAIDKEIFVAVQKRTDNIIELYAAEYGEIHRVSVDAIAITEKSWPRYILGVVDQLQQNGFLISGFNLVIGGNVPAGAGISSSAAVECAVVFALNELFELNILKEQMVKLAQKAEHEYAGVKCGIMDQFASMFGLKDKAILLDCHSLEYEYLPVEIPGLKFVLLDTNIKHSLASSQYNLRREQCESGVKAIQQKYPGVDALRDCNIQMLNECVAKNSIVYNRCKFIIEENERVLQAGKNLKDGDIHSFGKQMFETHDGLSRLYEVSCKESDLLVNAVKTNPDVIGARMMGGGFGGCTLNLVKEEAADKLVADLKIVYFDATGFTLQHYLVKLSDGTSRIK